MRLYIKMAEIAYKLGGKSGHKVIPFISRGWVNSYPHLLNDKIRYHEINGHIVSTVFLKSGMGSIFGPKGCKKPVVFETMIFEGTGDNIKFKPIKCWRNCSWTQAIAAHRNALEFAKLIPDILIAEEIMNS